MAKNSRAHRSKLEQSWSDLLSTASTPLMLVDSRRRIAFANQSLSEWVGLPLRQIVGRLVEYHSEPIEEEGDDHSGGVITGLCPPPAALAGRRTRGTLSCLGRDGRLRHRRTEFLALQTSLDPKEGFAVLAVLEASDFRRRGWVLASDATGRTITSTAQVALGDKLQLHVRDGTVGVVAEELHPEEE